MHFLKNNIKKSKLKKTLAIAVCCFLLLTSCGKTSDNDKKDSSLNTSKSQNNKAEFSFEEDKTDYKYKSTEELLANKENIASNGYVIIMDKNDIPDYMKDILIPFEDKKSNLYGYKTLMGEVKIKPKYESASDFADNKLAEVTVENDNGEFVGAVINSEGTLITDPNKGEHICWYEGDYIKYDNWDLEIHIVNEKLEEYDINSYFGDYPNISDLDITPDHIGYYPSYNSTGVKDIAYGKYKNGFLPFTKYESKIIKSGLMDSDGNIVAEHEDYSCISSVTDGYYVILDDNGRGLACDKSHNAVTEELEFSFNSTWRPMENIIYPGGYTYIYAETRNGTEAFPIKIAPELYKEKK